MVVSSEDAYGYASQLQSWTDIVAIEAGKHNTIGIKSDGAIVATGICFD